MRTPHLIVVADVTKGHATVGELHAWYGIVLLEKGKGLAHGS